MSKPDFKEPGPNFKVFQSSNLQDGLYDADSSTLTVHFVNGAQYVYFNVPVRRWEELKVAVSPGQYLREQIHPNHTYKRIPGDLDHAND